MKAVHHDLIKQRAYEIWERNGCPHGQDKDHWEQAERELLDAAPVVEPKPGKPAKDKEPSPDAPEVPPSVKVSARSQARPRAETSLAN